MSDALASPAAALPVPPARLIARGATVLLVMGLAALPFAVQGSWIYALGITFANAVAVLSVSVLVRYGGEVSIGHGFFAAVGAYTVAIMEQRLGVSILVSLPVGVALGVVSGIAFAWPSRNISGIYLAVSTMALALALPELINNAASFTGGYQGLYVAEPLVPGVSMSLQRYYVPLAALVLVALALGQFRR